MQTEPPFSEMTASARQALIREQTVIASMARMAPGPAAPTSPSHHVAPVAARRTSQAR